MTAYAELIIDQGSDFDLTLFVVDDAINSSANLASYTVRSSLKKSYYSANTYASFTTSIINGTAGIINISMNAHSTSAMKAGRYLFDVEVEDSTGRVTRILEGIATITPEVTR